MTVFTIYLALDTFLIPRVYTVLTEPAGIAASQLEQESSSGWDSSAVTLGETPYSDGNIDITITEYREYDTSIYAAEICLSSPEYLQTAFAQNSYGRNVTEKTSEIAENVNAILAINGDYYGSQETGYVLRNGVVYRSTTSDGQVDLVIYADGSFGFIRKAK